MREWLVRGATLLGLLAMLLPAPVLARGGGGNHYHGGHSSSGYRSSGGSYHYRGGYHSSSSYGSSRSYGSSGGGYSGPVPWFLDGNLAVAIIATVLFVLVLAWANYKAKYDPPVRHPWRWTPKPKPKSKSRKSAFDDYIQGWVKALAKDDPDFSLDNLYAKVRHVFDLLQRGWFERDLERVRPFLSDATFRRFVVQLDLMRRQGVRNAICDWEVLELRLVGVHRSQLYDTANVRIRARMRDTDVPAETSDAEAMAAAKKVRSEPFEEVWSFVRKVGTQSRVGADLFQGRCPNCGAPFHGGAANACEFCKAVVNSGNYDWTLAEITQGTEYARGHEVIDGLFLPRRSDPTLDLEILEDRASLVFWRWIEAQAEGNDRALSKLALGAFRDRLRAEVASLRADHRRKVFLDCAVGGVTTRKFTQDGGYDQAHVEVRWSARMGECPAQAPPPDLPSTFHRSALILVRKTGAQSRTDTGLATNRCGNCGAPLTDDGATSCEFCGAAVASAEHDWILSSAQPYVEEHSALRASA